MRGKVLKFTKLCCNAVMNALCNNIEKLYDDLRAREDLSKVTCSPVRVVVIVARENFDLLKINRPRTSTCFNQKVHILTILKSASEYLDSKSRVRDFRTEI